MLALDSAAQSAPHAALLLCQDANMTPVVVRLKVASETYQDEARVKASVQGITKITDWAKEARVRHKGLLLTVTVSSHRSVASDAGT